MARILIIDDDPFVRSMVTRALREYGHSVLVAEDGDQGLAVMTERIVDLVITDILMPRKEGIETIVELKTFYPDLPVLAMSGGGATSAPDAPLEDARLIGADDTLAKPFNLSTLIHTVDRLLASNAA